MAKPWRMATMLSVCTALLQAVACSDQPEIASAPCEVPTVQRPAVEVVLIDSDAEPICDIVLREVTRLKGSIDGTLARSPLTLAPDGRYVTATYQPGQVAVWSATGDLERVFGRGPGQGPGEFSRPRQLLVDGTGIVWVFDPFGTGYHYTIDGDYMGSLRFLLPAGMGGAALPDGRVVVTQGAIGGRPLAIGGPDGIEQFGPPTQSQGFIQVSAAGPDVWSSNNMYYEVMHHDLDTGEIDFRIRREADWFPEPTRQMLETGSEFEQPYGALSAFTVDPRGLIWAKPSYVMPQGREAPESPVDYENPGRTIDRRMEVFTFDGRLVASKLLLDPDPPIRAIGGNRWYYTEDDDLETIVIIEPVLVARGADR